MGTWYQNNSFLKKIGPFQKNGQRYLGRLETADYMLWNMLQNKQVGGYKFERQKRILGNVMSFYCKEAKLAVDLEHLDHKIRQKEEIESDRLLAKAGIKVLRFHRDIVLERPNSVKNSILEELSEVKKISD